MGYLYHFTTKEAYEAIIKCGYIKPMPIAPGSPISPLLWLTSDGDQNHVPIPRYKREIRFTINENEVKRLSAIDLAAESTNFSYTTYEIMKKNRIMPDNLVSNKNIYLKSIIEIRNVNTNEIYYPMDVPVIDCEA